MCGRYVLNVELEDIISGYSLNTSNLIGSAVLGEKFPGMNIPVIIKGINGREFALFKWGFKLNGIKQPVINGRLETILDKPSFKGAFLRRRCIIPATSFYEWQEKGKSKIKYEISIKDATNFSMAGLYENLFSEDGKVYTAVLILTCPANEQMLSIHHRMPVIIPKAFEDQWLGGEIGDKTDIQKMLLLQNDILWDIRAAGGAIQVSFDGF